MKPFAALVLAFIFQSASPTSVVDDLIAADRGFAAAGAKTNLIDGLAAMFAADVVMTSPAGLIEGKTKAIEALRANPQNTGARVEWTPVRGGISADGLHGFTHGYMTIHRADGTKAPVKYLAYWQRSPDGWRVTAYKRGAGGKGEPPLAMMAPVLPARMVTPSKDVKAIEQYRESLARAEREFSREAQIIGIGPAFRKYGSDRAINLGGPNVDGVLYGAEAISRGVSGGSNDPASPVSWGPEMSIVASSGDLGVTIGYIVGNTPGPDGKIRRDAFFTIWLRQNPDAPWRYVAE